MSCDQQLRPRQQQGGRHGAFSSFSSRSVQQKVQQRSSALDRDDRFGLTPLTNSMVCSSTRIRNHWHLTPCSVKSSQSVDSSRDSGSAAQLRASDTWQAEVRASSARGRAGRSGSAGLTCGCFFRGRVSDSHLAQICDGAATDTTRAAEHGEWEQAGGQPAAALPPLASLASCRAPPRARLCPCRGRTRRSGAGGRPCSGAGP